ncbi:Fic family protein [Deinococcus frigens]|uniref:Fic family protein n=1 Tax=Deinococcus frigens TaxID=249403 RepID=UPI0039EEF481
MEREDFVQRVGQLYGDLDHIHPFQEGNSRTLREFTRELAQHAGYELDWQSTGVDADARNRLYIARDVAMYERQYPGLNDEYVRAHDQDRDFAQMHHANAVLKRFAGQDRLETIIRENVTPQPQAQELHLHN